jgi:hypothetical protein
MKQEHNKYESLSLMSTILTATFSSIHHAYEIGFHAIILVVLFIVAPILLIRWIRNTDNKGALLIYGLLNAWLVVGLGLVDGLWNHILKPLSSQLQAFTAFHGGDTKTVENIAEGSFMYQATGVLTFIASIFAAYYSYKFIQLIRQSKHTNTENN